MQACVTCSIKQSKIKAMSVPYAAWPSSVAADASALSCCGACCHAAAMQRVEVRRCLGPGCHENTMLGHRKLSRWRPGPEQQVWSLAHMCKEQEAATMAAQWLHPLHVVTRTTTL